MSHDYKKSGLTRTSGMPAVIAGLVKKRAQLEAELEHHQRHVSKCLPAIEAINATLQLWEEGKYARYKYVKARYQINPGNFKWGELGRIVLEMLRASDHPMLSREIWEKVASDRNIDIGQRHLRLAHIKRMHAVVAELRQYKRIKSVGRIADRHLWGLVAQND